MNRILCVSLLLVSSLSFAATAKKVKLDVQLEINGVVVSHPLANITLGKKTTITQETQKGTASYVIEVTPTKDEKNNVMLAFAIRKIADGQTKILAQPQILDTNGQLASVEEKTDDNELLKLSVTPTL